MEINFWLKNITGDARSVRQYPRRIPYSARKEVARQLNKMQERSVIQPFKSPWSNPVVLVRKKDGSQRFCINYHIHQRYLRNTTKQNHFFCQQFHYSVWYCKDHGPLGEVVQENDNVFIALFCAGANP